MLAMPLFNPGPFILLPIQGKAFHCRNVVFWLAVIGPRMSVCIRIISFSILQSLKEILPDADASAYGI